MSALYNPALRQSKSLRSTLETYASDPHPTPGLTGQLATSLTAFARTLDDYTRAIDLELQPDKAAKGRDRLAAFRKDLADARSRFADLRAEKEAAQHVEQRGELLGRRGYAGREGGTPENPYADAAIASAGRTGQNVNPLFRSAANPDFVPGGSGGANPYSSYQSPYALNDQGADAAREGAALREQSFFASGNAALDEYIERGRAVLGDLGDQREMLKGTQRRLYSVGTTLGISGDTIRMVERRAKQDKWVFWGGVLGFVGFVWCVLHFLT